MHMPPNSFAKIVRIPVRIQTGKIVQEDGKPIPEMRDNVLGELIVGYHDFKNSKEAAVFNAEQSVVLLPKDHQVFLGLSLSGLNQDDSKHLKSAVSAFITEKECLVINQLPVEVHLLDDLILTIRGTKNPILQACRCTIPILENKEARSLNHAYTLISTRYETKRISHSGNAFLRGLVKIGNQWKTLNQLRGNF